jgi:RNA polymerase sigma-70 factor (ECF subfamily)
VFQEVFTRAFRHLHTLDNPEALKPWIAQLSRRACIDRVRATRSEVDIDAIVEQGERDPRLEQIEQALAVHRALDGLPEPYRDVVRRFFIEDQSYGVIADELGLPHGTIASRISRGLAMLRSAIGDRPLVAS